MAETGHAKNVENWQKMNAACTGFGGDYKPSNVTLTVVSMNILLTDVETEMTVFRPILYRGKTRLQIAIYTGVRPRTTQMLAAFKACGAAANKVDNMKTYQRQVRLIG